MSGAGAAKVEKTPFGRTKVVLTLQLSQHRPFAHSASLFSLHVIASQHGSLSHSSKLPQSQSSSSSTILLPQFRRTSSCSRAEFASAPESEWIVHENGQKDVGGVKINSQWWMIMVIFPLHAFDAARNYNDLLACANITTADLCPIRIIKHSKIIIIIQRSLVSIFIIRRMGACLI